MVAGCHRPSSGPRPFSFASRPFGRFACNLGKQHFVRKIKLRNVLYRACTLLPGCTAPFGFSPLSKRLKNKKATVSDCSNDISSAAILRRLVCVSATGCHRDRNGPFRPIWLCVAGFRPFCRFVGGHKTSLQLYQLQQYVVNGIVHIFRNYIVGHFRPGLTSPGLVGIIRA